VSNRGDVSNTGRLKLHIPDASPGRVRSLEIDAIIGKADPPVVGWFEFPISERLREIREEGSSEDEALLALLHIVLGFVLHVDQSKSPFGPKIVMTDGSRTPLPEDLSDEHFEALAAIRIVVQNIELKARLSDVLWQRKDRNVDDAIAAITAYLACAEAPSISWVDRIQRMKRAFQLAISLGRGAPDSYAEVERKLLSGVREIDADATYYAERLLRLLLRTERIEDERREFAALALRGAERAMREGDPNRAHAYYSTAAKWFDRLNSSDEAKNARIQAAETTVANALSQPQTIARAGVLADAVKELRNAGAPQHRIDEVRRILDDLQRESLSDMAVISAPIDVTEQARHVRTIAKGLPFTEALRRLGLLFSVPAIANLRTEALDLLRKYPLSQGLGGRQLGAGGRVTGVAAPLIGNESNEEALASRMRDGSNRYWQIAVVGCVLPFLEQTTLEHAPSVEDFLDFVAPKPFVPPGRETMFSLGLRTGFYGEWFESAHILVPQLENALRWLLESAGEIVYGQHPSGIQDYLGLEQILSHPKTIQILGEDIVFDLTGLLTDRIGANLRNRLAHGLLEWTSADINHAVYLWWLVLHLLFQLRYTDARQSRAPSSEAEETAS
jgi:hypothetical protein